MSLFFRTRRLLAAWLLASTLPCGGIAREWEDLKGRKVEAEYIGAQNGIAALRVSNRVVRIRIEDLIPADQAFIQDQITEERARALLGRLDAMNGTGSGDATRPPDPAGEVTGGAGIEARPSAGPGGEEEEIGGVPMAPKLFGKGKGTGTAGRSKEEIKQVLKQINYDSNTGSTAERAIRVLNAYRYLCGLEYDVRLNAAYEVLCVAAAKICAAIGRLDHNPPNPGWSQEEYQKGSDGAGRSNLFVGGGGAPTSVHAYMDDSDPGNIGALGHRRWCINPGMAETAFGDHDNYSAMYSFDGGRKKVPDWDVVAYPAPGYFPLGFFGERHAWSVTLNPEHYRIPDNITDLTITVARVRGQGKAGDPIRLDYTNLDRGGYGVSNCIIFRPESLQLKSGARYRVTIDGIKRGSGKTVALEYEVEFFRP